MKRRKMLVALSSVGVTAFAGCSGGDNGNDGSDGGQDSNDNESSDGGETTDGGENSNEGDSSSAETEDSFSIGDPIWSQRNGSSGTRSANVTGIQSDDPSSYTIGTAYEPVITQNAIITGSQIYDAADGSAVRPLAVSATKSPALAGDTVVMIADSDVVAVNVRSGEEEWRYTTASPATTITATEENAYVGTEAGLAAVSMSDGERIWDKQNLVPPANEENRTIAVIDSGVYINRLNESYIFDLADGSEIYRTEAGANSIRAILAPDGGIYEQRGTIGGDLVKLDAEGNSLWNIGSSIKPHAADEDYVYATTNPDRNESDEGFLTAHNAADGSIDWSFELPNGSVETAAVGSDRVYILSSERIFAVNKSSGEREAIYSATRSVTSLALGEGLLALVRKGLGDEGTTFFVD